MGDAAGVSLKKTWVPDDVVPLSGLGHDDYDPRIERPEHRACNRTAANQLKTSREW